MFTDSASPCGIPSLTAYHMLVDLPLLHFLTTQSLRLVASTNHSTKNCKHQSTLLIQNKENTDSRATHESRQTLAGYSHHCSRAYVINGYRCHSATLAPHWWTSCLGTQKTSCYTERCEDAVYARAGCVSQMSVGIEKRMKVSRMACSAIKAASTCSLSNRLALKEGLC